MGVGERGAGSVAEGFGEGGDAPVGEAADYAAILEDEVAGAAGDAGKDMLVVVWWRSG